jgi:hypothetical protein
METLRIFSGVFVGLGFLCALIVYIDINLGRYQKMPIMNLAWVITCSYSGFLGLYMYFKYGRADKPMMDMGGMDMKGNSCGQMAAKPDAPKKAVPMWVKVYISSTHCGAGCGSADIVSENLIFYLNITFWGLRIYAAFIIDYIFALVFGVVFQYLNIRPMQPELTRGQAWMNAIKADVASLTTFQIGMYGWIAIMKFCTNIPMDANTFTFWFMMQIGLTIGLLTTFPMNYILIKYGIKKPCVE